MALFGARACERCPRKGQRVRLAFWFSFLLAVCGLLVI
jgi:hypothetical protein